MRNMTDDFETFESQVLGQGSYGRVVKGKNKNNGEAVAIKYVKKKGL